MQRPRLRAHPSPRLPSPRSRAGEAQAGSWTVRGQRTPNQVFRGTLERGGFWGIKFPPAAPGLFRACASPHLAARGGVFRGGVYGVCAVGSVGHLSSLGSRGRFPHIRCRIGRTRVQTGLTGLTQDPVTLTSGPRLT